MLGALALGAVFFMGRARAATTGGVNPLAALLNRGPTYSRNIPGQPNSVAMGAAGGSLLGSILKTGSPDVVASGGYTGGGVFSDIGSYDNAQWAIDGQVASTLTGPVGLMPPASQWYGAVGGPQSQFYLPDQTNSNQYAYAGFDDPSNYG
jgi:hypothetical protein